METVTTVNVTGKTNNMDEKATAKAKAKTRAEKHAELMRTIMQFTPEQKAQFMSLARDFAEVMRGY